MRSCLRCSASSAASCTLKGSMATPTIRTAAPNTGEQHNELPPPGERCRCSLCQLNAPGSKLRCMVADAKECSEGISFLGVRRLLLVDVPTAAIELLQRVGRAVRFMGHDSLPAEQRNVHVVLYHATLPASDESIDRSQRIAK